MVNKKTDIIDIFSSVQGEGLRVGERQIFIRFHGCNLNCDFCDIDRSKKSEKVSVKEVLERVDRLNSESIHNTVNITGGEPLLQNAFLKRLLPQIAERGFKICLETNGTLVEELNDVIKYVDTIAVDIKLPSVTGNKPCWQEHKKFLRAVFKKEFFVKIVVSNRLDMEDFDKAVEIMKKINFDIPFVIQPETRKNSQKLNISSAELLELQARALKSLNHVLVIPQAHKMLGVR